jgi:predicted nucleotidyltransferase
MRLKTDQIETIRQTIASRLGGEAAVYVFGSRLSDEAQGGDVDIFVDTPLTADYGRRASTLAELETRLALPVDLLVKDAIDQERPIHRLARLTGARLG